MTTAMGPSRPLNAKREGVQSGTGGMGLGMGTGHDEKGVAALPFRTQDGISHRARADGLYSTGNCQNDGHDAEDELHCS